MTDWFVNSNAVGDQTAQTPPNAITNVQSLYATGSVGYGDRIWVNPSYSENDWGVYEMRIGDGGDAQSEHIHCIGWPHQGDPFYNERPQSGIDDGWDSDTQTEGPPILGDYPTFASSMASASFGMRWGAMHSYYNMNFINSGGFNVMGIPFDQGEWVDQGRVWADNIGYAAHNGIDANCQQHGKVRGFFELTAGEAMFEDTVYATQVHVLSGSYFPHLTESDRNIDIQAVHIDTASMEHFLKGNVAPVTKRTNQSYGVITGQRPWNADADYSTVFDETSQPYCSDYYGEGPKRFYRPGGWTQFITSSAELMWGGTRALINEIGSNAISGGDHWQYYPKRLAALSRVAVTSGTPLGVDWPLLTVATSLTNGTQATILALDGRVPGNIIDAGSRNISTGSTDGWTGTLLSTGSAWTISGTFTPEFTGDLSVALMLGSGVNSVNTAISSGQFMAAVSPDFT